MNFDAAKEIRLALSKVHPFYVIDGEADELFKIARRMKDLTQRRADVSEEWHEAGARGDYTAKYFYKPVREEGGIRVEQKVSVAD